MHAAVCYCVVFLLFEVFILLWDYMHHLKEEPPQHGLTDWVCGIISFQFSPHSSSSNSVPGAGHIQINQAVSAFRSSQYFNHFLYLSVDYFCLNEVFPGPPSELKWLLASLSPWWCSTCVPKRMRGPVDPYLDESKSKTQGCGHLITQMGHHRGGYVANGPYAQEQQQ